MRVLVQFDGSELSEKAVDHATRRFRDPEVALLYVLDFVGAGYEAAPRRSSGARPSP